VTGFPAPLAAALLTAAAAGAEPVVSEDPVARAQAHVAGFCGAAEYADGWAQPRDLNGDGTGDLLIRYLAACYGHPAPFCGSAGCMTELWYGLGGGRMQLMLRSYMLAVEPTLWKGVPAVRISTAGLACGKGGGELCVSVNTFSGGDFLTLWANYDRE